MVSKKNPHNPGTIRSHVPRIITGWILVMILLTGIIGMVTASEPTIVVSSYQVQPEVIMPGGTAMITVVVTNTAQKASITSTGVPGSGQSVTTTNDINVYLSDVYLFGNGLRVDSGDYRRVGEIGPGQSMPLTFLIQAPDYTGIYFPELHIATDGGRSLKYPIPVNVNDDRLIQKNPAIQVDKQFPDAVIPGENAEGSLVLHNTGETAASEIFVNISTKNQEVALKSPQTSHISRLGPGDQSTISLQIITSTEAAEGIQQIVCHIQYSTASGVIRQQDEIIPIRITGRPTLAIASVTSDPVRIQEGTPFSLIVRIENTGTGDAEGVRAGIHTSMAGTKEAFVGKIGKDNDAPAVFYLQNPPAGDLTIPITVHQQDDGESIDLHDTLSITISTRNQLPLLQILVILILVGVCAVLFQQSRKEKKG
ncbi:MAG TPA: hypothetical protein VN372_02895 [Methanospirillum sp.]|nr:hypothetical protein [Methanospirillum sp.]